MTLRSAAVELRRIASETRAVAERLEGSTEPERWAIGRDVRAVAATLERYADIADRVGIAAAEPDPDAWLRDAAPGELQEMFGR